MARFSKFSPAKVVNHIIRYVLVALTAVVVGCGGEGEIVDPMPPDDTPPAAIGNLAVGLPTQETVNLIWTAPGDDGGVGKATRYEAKFSQSTITSANWDTATDLVNEPLPSSAGAAEGFKTDDQLSPGTTYYFAIRAVDEQDNMGPVSNTVRITTLPVSGPPEDQTPPAPIDNVAPSTPTATSLTITWTAPADDGDVQTVFSYEIRISTVPISTANWAAADSVARPWIPAQQPGVVESFTLSLGGLQQGVHYYIAIRAIDVYGNLAPVGDNGEFDTPPGAQTCTISPVGTLAFGDVPVAGGTSEKTFTIRNAGSGTVSGTLSESCDDYLIVEPDKSYSLAAGQTKTFTVRFDPSSTGEKPCTIQTGNSACSDVSCSGRGIDDPCPALAPDPIMDLTAPEASATTIKLKWTSPTVRQGAAADGYQIRRSATPITAENWDEAEPVAIPNLPRSVGSAESLLVTALAPETPYYFAIRSDDGGCDSPLSNVVSQSTTGFSAPGWHQFYKYTQGDTLLFVDLHVHNGELYGGGVTGVSGTAGRGLVRWDAVAERWRPVADLGYVWKIGSYGPDLIVIYGNTSNNPNIVAKISGGQTTTIAVLSGGSSIRDMAEYQGELYLAGAFGMTIGGVERRDLVRYNGTRWADVGGWSFAATQEIEVFSNKLYVIRDTGSNRGVYVWDGASLARLPGATFNTYYSLAVYENQLYIGGSFSTIGDPAISAANVAQYVGDGLWAPVGGGLGGKTVTKLSVVGDALLAERTDEYWQVWRGSAWTADTGVPGQASSAAGILATEVFGGSLIVGGLFKTAGNGISVSTGTRWDGSDEIGLAIWNPEPGGTIAPASTSATSRSTRLR